MRVRRAQHEGPRLAREIDIVAVAAGPDEEARILLAADGCADSGIHEDYRTPSMPRLFGDSLPWRRRITIDAPRVGGSKPFARDNREPALAQFQEHTARSKSRMLT
jgi:hypothetical protein